VFRRRVTRQSLLQVALCPAGPVDSRKSIDDGEFDYSGNSDSSQSFALERASGSTRREVRKLQKKHVGGRLKKRQRCQHLASAMHNKPASQIPTSHAEDLLRGMLDASIKLLTRLHCALFGRNAAVAGGTCARRLRLWLPWWLRQAAKDAPWRSSVVFDKYLVVWACAKESCTVNTATEKSGPSQIQRQAQSANHAAPGRVYSPS